MFWGIFFLQGVPEVQRQLWMKPQLNMLCIGVVCALTLPFTSLGFVAYWLPSYMEYLPISYLQFLCMLANASPPDYHAVLGVPHTATRAEISKAYRNQALTCHPDKIPESTPEHERIVLTDRFAKIGEANDMLSRERNSNVPLLNELQPRCGAALFLGFYWVLHMMLDFVEIEQSKEKARENLRDAVINNSQESMPVNLYALGIEDRDTLTEYCKDDSIYYGMPLVQKNNLEDVKEMRELLGYAGIKLKPLPKNLPDDTPLFLPPPKQQQQQQQGPPGWVQWLLQDEQKDNVLALAFKGDTEGVVKALGAKENPQSPHATISPGQRSAVYLAAMNGHVDVIKALRAHGADVRFPDENGISPLHMASAGGHADAAQMLVKCGADVNQAGRGKLAPLHVACIEGHGPCVELLLAKGAKIVSLTENGETCLFLAARSGHTQIVNFLVVKHKAEPNVATTNNITPIWIATCMGHLPTVAVLHSLGADTSISPTKEVEPANLIGLGAIEAARALQKQQIVDLLERAVALRKEVEGGASAAAIGKARSELERLYDAAANAKPVQLNENGQPQGAQEVVQEAAAPEKDSGAKKVD